MNDTWSQFRFSCHRKICEIYLKKRSKSKPRLCGLLNVSSLETGCDPVFNLSLTIWHFKAGFEISGTHFFLWHVGQGKAKEAEQQVREHARKRGCYKTTGVPLKASPHSPWQFPPPFHPHLLFFFSPVQMSAQTRWMAKYAFLSPFRWKVALCVCF